MGEKFPLCLERNGALDRRLSQSKNDKRRQWTLILIVQKKRTEQSLKTPTQGKSYWYKDALLVSLTMPRTQIILTLLPVVFIDILHTDPFLNFNLSLKVLVGLIQPSYLHLSHGQRQLASLDVILIYLCIPISPQKGSWGSPWQIAQSFLFLMPTF